MTKSIADRMAGAAELDLGLPYSLVLDALDHLEFGGMEPLIREWVGKELTAALDRYETDPLSYWTDERVARARGEDADYAAETEALTD